MIDRPNFRVAEKCCRTCKWFFSSHEPDGTDHWLCHRGIEKPDFPEWDTYPMRDKDARRAWSVKRREIQDECGLPVKGMGWQGPGPECVCDGWELGEKDV